jgi:hypothetical protein
MKKSFQFIAIILMCLAFCFASCGSKSGKRTPARNKLARVVQLNFHPRTGDTVASKTVEIISIDSAFRVGDLIEIGDELRTVAVREFCK